jgi:hypothetical protein
MVTKTPLVWALPWFAQSFPVFSSRRLTQANAWSTAVFVDEFDTSFFQSVSNFLGRCLSAPKQSFRGF